MSPYTSDKTKIELKVGSMNVFNYALYENGVSPVRGIKVRNNTLDTLMRLELAVSSDSGFLKDCRMPVLDLPAGKWIELPDPKISVNGKYLAEVTEAFTINIEVAVLEGSVKLYEQKGQMSVLAYHVSFATNGTKSTNYRPCWYINKT